jgi:FtsP/CotA-like multicopper oxidase with cupredoxin domain
MKKLISSLLGPAENEVSRRKFLRLSALGLAVPASSAVLAACQQAGTSSPTGSTSAMEGHDESATPSAQTDDKWEEMDRMHEEGVKAFPAKTEGVANEILPYTMDGDVKVFELTAAITKWQVTQTVTVDAWTFNGAMPGPQIRVTEGDRIRINFKNDLPESTAIHFHGLIVPNEVDGVPFITQPPVRPGESYSYEFTVKNPGSHMYHSHYNSTKQVGKGLLGAFIVDPKDPNFYGDKKIDKEYIMILNDANGGFTINGKGFPATEVLTAKVGERILVRYMNEGLMIHPMHLHGFPQEVIAKDGWPQNPWLCDTLNVAPGERWDVIIEPTDVGVWAFHCHVLSHAEGEHGMFGMVTALVVTDENGKVPEKLEYLLAGGRDSAYICKV